MTTHASSPVRAGDRRVYVDANIIVHALAGREPTSTLLRDLIARSRRGEITILTSVVSLVEVAYLERADAEDAKRLDTFWKSGAVEIVQLGFNVANTARELVREFKRRTDRLEPMDAIHVASAHHAKASVLITTDPDFDQVVQYGKTIVRRLRVQRVRQNPRCRRAA